MTHAADMLTAAEMALERVPTVEAEEAVTASHAVVVRAPLGHRRLTPSPLLLLRSQLPHVLVVDAVERH